jgi:hypothetical protein
LVTLKYDSQLNQVLLIPCGAQYASILEKRGLGGFALPVALYNPSYSTNRYMLDSGDCLDIYRFSQIAKTK